MWALALLLAATCPKVQHPALTAFSADGQVRLAIVPEGAPLLSGTAGASVELLPIENARTATLAAILEQSGELACGATIAVSRADLRSPVDLDPLDAPLHEVVLAPHRGVMSEGAAQEARLARIFDLATFKSADAARLPLHLEDARVVRVPGGSALSLAIEGGAFGVVDRVFGPVVRLNEAATSTTPIDPAPSFLFSPSTAARIELDDREGSLRAGDRVQASSSRYGAIDRALVASPHAPYDPGDVAGRFFVAHGLALGLPSLSLGFSMLTQQPECNVLCNPRDQPIPGDRAFLARFLARDDASIARASARLNTSELLLIAGAFTSVLLPTARRGVISRLEILEDVLIIGEGVLVGLTTPVTLQTRFGRARPLIFRPNAPQGNAGRDAVGAPFVAVRTSAASAASTAAITLLFVEEAGPGWVVPAILGFGALTTYVAYSELDAGRAFPSDIPLAVINGFTAGAGVVLWNRIFWRGWPGDTSRGDLPLRLRGIDLRFANDVAIATLSGEL